VRGVTPILNVSNLADSFDWFAKLGWAKLWDYPEPDGTPSFGAVGCGQCEMFVCLNGQGGRGAGNGVWLSIFVDDVDAVYARCQEHGLEVTHPPTNEPWGMREMRVRHPDGHVFRIGHGIQG
jgi:catechol 2,3-dioxygenase-like lactoylglutathione lyase family enzyme